MTKIPPPATLKVLLGTPSTAGTHQKNNRLLRQSPRFERQPKTRPRLNDKAYLPNSATPARPGDIAIFSPKTQEQRLEQNEPKDKYVPHEKIN